MSNVIDFRTGEPIQYRAPAKRKPTQETIESIYQRRHQIDDIVIGYFEKGTGQFRFALSCREDLNLRLLQLYMHSYMEAYADLD